MSDKGKVDPISLYVAEFWSGYRCMICEGTRGKDTHGRCDHERAEDLAESQFEVESFLRASGADRNNRRHNGLFGASASALRRASLRAGGRELPHRHGESVTQAVTAGHRGRTQGKTIEWRPHQRPSGDELPL